MSSAWEDEDTFYSSQILQSELSRVDSTQESIHKLSSWIIQHHKSLSDIVRVWEEEFFDASDDKRLIFFYVLNEVLQNGRKQFGDKFVNKFWRILVSAVRLFKPASAVIQRSVTRVLEVWQERCVLPPGNFFLESRHLILSRSHGDFSKEILLNCFN